MNAPVSPQDTVSHSDRAAMRAIERGELRGIGKQRKRTLRRQGIRVFWCEFLGSYAWNPKDRVVAHTGGVE
jgi:hypothetical protein